MNRRYKATITKGNTLFFWYATKIRFQYCERMLYIQYINNSEPLSIYIYTVACRVGGRGTGGEVQGMWKDVSRPSTFQNSIRFMQNIFGKISQLPLFRSIKNHPTSSCHFFLSDLSILWQCKRILSSKQNHKFKHIKATSTKPLGWIKFTFSNATFLVSAHHYIYMSI